MPVRARDTHRLVPSRAKESLQIDRFLRSASARFSKISPKFNDRDVTAVCLVAAS